MRDSAPLPSQAASPALYRLRGLTAPAAFFQCSANYRRSSRSNLPIRYVLALPVAPVTHKIGESGGIQHSGNGIVHAQPHVGERIVGSLFRCRLLGALYMPEDLAYRGHLRAARQEV